MIADLRALSDEHPFRERFCAQLMLALYRGGRQAEALEKYRTTRLALVRNLGIEPAAALSDLERAMLRHDPALEAAERVDQERSILVAAFDSRNIERLLALAALLARDPPREVIVVRPNVARADLPAATRDLAERRERLRHDHLSVRTVVFNSTSPGVHVVRIAAEQNVDLVLVDAPADLLHDEHLFEILSSAPCDTAVLAGGPIRPGPVLVPFIGAEHDWSTVEIAAWLARATGEQLRIAGPATADSDASRLLADASLAVQRALDVVAEPELLDPGPDDLVRASERSGIVVGGLSDRWRVEGLGPTRAALAAGRTPVVLVRRGLRPGGLAPPESYTRFTWTVLPVT